MGSKKLRLVTEFWVDKDDAYGLAQGFWDKPQTWHRTMLEVLGMCESPSFVQLIVHDVGMADVEIDVPILVEAD